MLANFAAAAVLAGVAVALVGLDLAVLSGEARPAGAGVAALTRVGARGVVLARLVVGAVVQVWSSETGRGQSESVQQTREPQKVCVSSLSTQRRRLRSVLNI